jgi:hypothetical protein
MDTAQTLHTLTEARGFAELGLWQDAWDLIESLPPAMRTSVPALAVRLLVCAGLGKWEMGAELVRLFGPVHPLEMRKAAGSFHLARAESLCAAGDIEGAQKAVKALSTIWPEGRGTALNSPVLEALW